MQTAPVLAFLPRSPASSPPATPTTGISTTTDSLSTDGQSTSSEKPQKLKILRRRGTGRTPESNNVRTDSQEVKTTEQREQDYQKVRDAIFSGQSQIFNNNELTKTANKHIQRAKQKPKPKPKTSKKKSTQQRLQQQPQHNRVPAMMGPQGYAGQYNLAPYQHGRGSAHPPFQGGAGSSMPYPSGRINSNAALVQNPNAHRRPLPSDYYEGNFRPGGSYGGGRYPRTPGTNNNLAIVNAHTRPAPHLSSSGPSHSSSPQQPRNSNHGTAAPALYDARKDPDFNRSYALYRPDHTPPSMHMHMQNQMQMYGMPGKYRPQNPNKSSYASDFPVLGGPE